MQLKYFINSLWVSFFGLILAFFVGYEFSGQISQGFSAVFLAFVLSILEVSLSFDNAVINASVLEHMSPIWRKRFITWGILIAVFGMRLVFPLLVVSVLTGISPWAALVLAAKKPDEYAQIMTSAHTVLAGFGGSFLLMVCLKYFFNKDKEIHWIHFLERPLVRLGKIEAVEAGLVLLFVYYLSKYLPSDHAQSFFIASVFGTVTFIFVDGLSALLNVSDDMVTKMEKASVGLFLYLEVLDATFSFDGVVGAFALTNNLFIIAIGLGIGAMFVRSLTIFLLDKGTLSEFRYLEHGAFYAIGALALLMLFDGFMHVPEVLTGLIGAVFIGLSVLSSIYHKKAKG